MVQPEYRAPLLINCTQESIKIVTMSEKQLEITTKRDMREWTRRMELIYDRKLAVTHTLHIHDTKYPVNAALLRATLPTIAPDQWTNSFSGISPALVDQLLRYLYSCEITVSLMTLKELMLACEDLKLGHLQEACEEFLRKDQILCPENYIGWYKFCCEKFEKTTGYCKERIEKELDKVRHCREFHDLSLAELHDLIKEHKDADTQFHAVMSWVLVDENRQDYIEELIDFINVAKCSKEYLGTANKAPYEQVLKSAAVQNKLFRASLDLQAKNTKHPQTEYAPYVPKEDTDKDQMKHSLGLQYQSNMEFAKAMTESFQQFKECNTNTDIVLQLSDGTIRAHQIVLASISPYFATLLTSGENAEVKEDLTKLDSSAVRALVDYMYSGEIKISDSTLLEHIKACDILQLNTLSTRCKDHATNELDISPNNCFQWIMGSKRFNLPKTRRRAIDYICQNFEHVYSLPSLRELGHDDLLELLNNDALGCIPEDILYEVIASWIMGNQDNRRGYLNQFLASRAMKQCSVKVDLDVPAILRKGHFDSDEREMVWEARHRTLQRALKLARENENRLQQELNTANEPATPQNQSRMGWKRVTKWLRRRTRGPQRVRDSVSSDNLAAPVHLHSSRSAPSHI